MANLEYDIVVIGGGNAALCAAITARRTGAKVLVLEAAPNPIAGAIRATPEIFGACMTAHWAFCQTPMASMNITKIC